MDLKDFKKYIKHLPNCNIMQDWSEAETAMVDTPERFRDHDWAMAREELNIKMGTCTCGLEKLLDDASALPIPDVSGSLPFTDIQVLCQEAKDLVERLLPPHDYGEDYDVCRLYEILEELEGNDR